MASGTSAAALLLPVLVLVLFAAGARADDGAIVEFSPARARRAGPPPPPPSIIDGGVVVRAEKESSCPLIRVPDLVDACRSPPGLRGCAAQCVVYHYRGGYCDMPNGRPGDCYCTNCLPTTRPATRNEGMRSHYH